LSDRNLFAHLAFNFSSHPENLAVEALGHILRRSAAATSAFEGFLTRLGSSVDGPLTFRTQVAADDGTRPDLVGFDSKGRESVHIEAKFWAGLTDQQPVGYLHRLPKQGSATLLFLAPATRLSTVWPKILRRAGDAGFEVASKEGVSDAAPTVASVNKRILLAIAGWNPVLQEVLAEVEGAGEIEVAADIRQLVGLCKRMDDEAFQPLRTGDMGLEWPRRILQLNAIARDVVQILKARGLSNQKGLAAAGSFREYGHYFRCLDVEAWIGTNYEYWSQIAETPLWFRTQHSEFARFLEFRSAFTDLERGQPPRVFVDGKAVLFPIHLPLGAEREEVVNAVINQVLDICSRFEKGKVGGELN
jgi:hypothetical protein